MKSFDEFKDQLDEKYQVVAKTKDGETFKSGVYDTKKKAYDMHWKLAKGNKHKSVETVKVDEEVELDEMTQGKSYTEKQLKDKIDSGKWEATHDIKPGKHVEMRHQSGKKVMVHVKEEVELDEAVYSIKNIKTGQIYFHSKYPITKDNSRLKRIQAAGGDHIHATPHKDGKPINEQINQGDTMSNMDQYINAIGENSDFRGGLEEQQKKAHTVPKSEKEKDLAKLAPPHDKITHADVMVGRGVKKEEVELDEAKDMMKVAGDIESYAKNHGGIDKADMLKVAGMIKRGDMKGAEKYTMRLDSDPRDFLLSKMGFNEAKEPPFEMPYKKAEPTTKTDKSGAVHTPMSRARDLARQAMKKQMKENFDLDITDEQADSLVESANLEEKTLTPAQLKKREEIAKAMERKDPGMDMSKKMAIATATAKKVAEETEELDEISKATLGSYIKKAKGSAIGAAQVTGMGAGMTGEKTQAKAERKVQKRASGINKAVDRLTSEEVESVEEAMITYTDFMDKIKMHRKAGNKIVDDKYSDKHATYTSVDSEGTAKKITHTPAGVKQQHMGNMKADDDQAAETQPAEKRSRGRPAGSKSGVSKYNK